MTRELKDEPNLGALQATLLMEALYRCGVRRVLLAPGSRSTPLVRAAVTHGGFDRTLRVDERGLAFHAVGIGRASRVPAVVITTSGTAVANLLPAAVEAAYDHVPVLFVTADRPPELHGVGANQSIAQDELLTPTVAHRFDLPAPGADFDPVHVIALAEDAFARSVAEGGTPVHINCAFREPLAPTEAPWDRACLTSIAAWVAAGEEAPPPPTPAVLEETETPSWARAFVDAKRPLLILGAACAATGAHGAAASGRPTEQARLITAARVAGAVVVADLRSTAGLGNADAHVTHFADRWLPHLAADQQPSAILQVGGRLISKRLHQFLAAQPTVPFVLVDAHVESPLPDMTHATHIRRPARYAADALHRATSTRDAVTPAPSAALTPWQDQAATLDAAIERALTRALDEGRDLSEAFVARWLSRSLNAGHALFTSNSLPVRLLSDFAVRRDPATVLGANRGASGIDGIVSSAVGFAEGAARPTTLLIGDLALLHDIGSLGCLKYADQPLTILVLNNGGGGIFAYLPVAEHEALFSPWFETPHGMTFSAAANQFGLRYFEVSSRADLDEAYTTATRFGDPALIEVRTTIKDTRQVSLDLDALLGATARAAVSKAASGEGDAS